LLRSDDDRDAAREAIRQIDTVGTDAIPVLLEALKAGDRRTGFFAVYLLGKLGPDAKEALPELKELREQRSPRFRQFIDSTIRKIEGNEADD
jgi:hypothetical protein